MLVAVKAFVFHLCAFRLRGKEPARCVTRKGYRLHPIRTAPTASRRISDQIYSDTDVRSAGRPARPARSVPKNEGTDRTRDQSRACDAGTRSRGRAPGGVVDDRSTPCTFRSLAGAE